MPIQIDLGPAPQKEKKASGPVVGIDLGTTNSLVAFADAEGKPKVLKDEEGRALVPSLVAFTPEGSVERVGESARELRLKRPRDVFFSVKRLMGRSLKDLAAEKDQIPFALVDDELHSQTLIQLGEKTLSPIEISAEILKRLKAIAERNLGQKIERAVITVPAYFDDAQRSATKAAGRLAGLDVLRVFNEPTAAALAYGWSNQNPGRVAVYDLGGGTFDLSLLRIESNVYEVLSTAGDTHLGGDDFDLALAEHVLSALNLEKTPEIWAEARVEAERVKKELSVHNSVDFVIGEKKVSISRAEAEELWKPLVERTLNLCARALEDAKLSVRDLNDVLLVGGSTRLLMVRRAVEDFFKRPPNTSLDPDEAVALGASLQAEVLGGGDTDRLLLDVVPLSLGIETMGGVVSKIIPRNSTIPTEAREIYTNHSEKQTAFDIHVLQGERELVKDARSLARFKLRGLSPAPAGYHRVEILFRIDANGILSVRARDLRSGKAHEIEVKPSFGISEDALVKMLEESVDRAEDDMQARQQIDLRLEAESAVRATEKALVTSQQLADPQDLAEIKARLIDLKNAMNGPSIDVLRSALDRLDEVTRELAELQVNAALKEALSGRDFSKV